MGLKVVGGRDIEKWRHWPADTPTKPSAYQARRAAVNDEQALEDMTRGTLADVPRDTHLRVRQEPPTSGAGLLLGCLIVTAVLAIGYLIGCDSAALLAEGGH